LKKCQKFKTKKSWVITMAAGRPKKVIDSSTDKLGKAIKIKINSP